jgi:SpoIID/LytB domain protein
MSSVRLVVAARRALVLAIVLALAVAMLALPAQASEEAPMPGSSLRLVGEPGTVFTVRGHGRYGDTLEVRPAPDGRLIVINELSMDRYVDGLAEMPASWPMEALKAQAVAARTYAWRAIALGNYRDRGLGFDICATVACQVFKGRAVVESSGGERWAEAVEQTAGETLTWQGAPILARYFSSSGGHTRNNEHVFGSMGGSRPYLQGVPDPDEAISPHHRWQFELRRAELDHLFSHGETLRDTVPVREIRWIAGDETRVDQIRVTGWNGHVVELSASRLRAWISEVGPQVLPYRFPVVVDGRTLPDGLPTSRLQFCFTCKEDVVVIAGRGWGHGVGMSQWGARGKAEGGLGHDEILAAYYNGLRPEVSAELPQRVRVGLTWEAESAVITADGPFTAVVDDQATKRFAGETWRVRRGDAKGLTALGPDAQWLPAPEELSPPEDAREPDAAVGQLDTPPRSVAPARSTPSPARSVEEATTDDEVDAGLRDHVRRAVSYIMPRSMRLMRGILGASD